MAEFIFDREQRTFNLAFNPHSKRWMIDTTGLQCYHLEKFKVTIVATQCFAVNLCHIAAFDFRVLQDGHGNKAFVTVKVASMGNGDLYQTDTKGFGYRSIILFAPERRLAMNSTPPYEYFIIAENLDGRWCVIQVLSVTKRSFTETKVLVEGCVSEEDAINRLILSDKDVDLKDTSIFTRIDQSYVDRCLKEERERDCCHEK